MLSRYTPRLSMAVAVVEPSQEERRKPLLDITNKGTSTGVEVPETEFEISFSFDNTSSNVLKLQLYNSQ